jgi:hypothetical protein
MFSFKQLNGLRCQFDGSTGGFGAAKMRDERSSLGAHPKLLLLSDCL